MTTGYGLVNPTTQSYPAQMMALYNNVCYTSQNLGVNSQTTADMIADGVAQVDPLYNPSNALNILSVLCGTNDLWFGASAATTYSRITTYHAARRAAGFKTVAFTILPRTEGGVPPTFEADRQTVNTNIRNNWTTWADALADVAADNRIGAAGASDDTTYYQGDGVHPNATGAGIIAAIAKAAADTI